MSIFGHGPSQGLVELLKASRSNQPTWSYNPSLVRAGALDRVRSLAWVECVMEARNCGYLGKEDCRKLLDANPYRHLEE